jgi:hypothetical protein
MVQALYLALHLFISGYFAPSLIHTGDTQAKTPWSSRERDRLRTAKNTAAVAVPLKQCTPATHPAHVQPRGVTARSSHQITLGTMTKGSCR